MINEKKKKQKEVLNRIIDDLERIDPTVLKEYLIFSVKEADGLTELYLALGADPNVAMQYALNGGKAKEVELLYKYGGKIDSRDMGIAISNKYLDIIKFMLENGIKPNKSHLEQAITENCANIVELLIPYIDEIEEDIVHKAIFTSPKMIELILPKIEDKFPKNAFYSGLSMWGKFDQLPTDVLKYVLHIIENEPEKISNILESNVPSAKDIDYGIYMALMDSYEKADYDRIKLLVKYVEKHKIRYPIQVINLEILVENAKTTKELNQILRFLKKRGLIQQKFVFEDYFISKICKKASIDTLILCNIVPRQEHFKFAIECVNKQLVVELLKMGIKPKESDVKQILKDYENSKKDGWLRKDRWLQNEMEEIFQMLNKTKS